MSNELDKILISSSQPEWHARLREIHAAVKSATYFEDGSDEDKQLDYILKEVSERGDTAITEFTERFDGIRLQPKNFLVDQEDLAKAVGVSRQSIISIEQGRYIPSLPLALKFRKLFQCSTDELFELQEEI